MGEEKMQRAPESGLMASPVHVLEDIVNGHHIGTRQIARQPEQVGNVEQVAAQTLEDGEKIEIALYGGVRAQQRYSVNSRRQRTDLRHLFRRPDQKIFTLAIQAAQRANDIASV